MLALAAVAACSADHVVVARRLIEAAQGGAGPSSPEDGGAGGATADDTAAYLFVLLDESGTMGDGVNGDPLLRWDPVTRALNTFLSAPPEPRLQASLTLFPPNIFKSKIAGVVAAPTDTNDSICQLSTYTQAEVPMTALPNSLTFAGALSEVTPPNERGTPTAPALRGTLAQAEALLQHVPSAPTNVVLITDGVPGSCELIDDAIAAAKNAYPAIATYVVVVGSDPKPFHALAAAGGTGRAVGVPDGDPLVTEASMFEALSEIQARARTR